MQKINSGTNEDGSVRWHYISDGHVVLTGPIAGGVTLSDGTEYDVTPEVIEVAEDHVGEVAHLIGKRFEDEGHPNHIKDASAPPFVHECTELCPTDNTKKD